jgi:hypothetical protein
MKIDFAQVSYAYKNIKEQHKNHLCFEKLIATYDCFNEGKWTSRKPRIIPVIKERVKIGNLDSSKENIYKKELVLSLNKLTAINMDTVGISIVKNYKPSLVDIFVLTLWEYFKRQPSFQDVYIKLVEKLPDFKDIKDRWFSIRDIYMKTEIWKLNYELIEQSHNYDDFCEYIKQKKELNAMAQGWSRLMNLGIINTDVFEWCSIVVEYCMTLDLSNIVYKTMIDSYIEQIREFCKFIKLQVPEKLIDDVSIMKTLNIQKSTKFKIEDFVNENKK